MKIIDYGQGIAIRGVLYVWPQDEALYVKDLINIPDASEVWITIYYHGRSIAADNVKGKVLKNSKFPKIAIRDAIKRWRDIMEESDENS